MGFFATFLWSLALMVVGELLRPKQKPQDATAASVDDFGLPTVSEDRNIPWFAGTVKIEGPNLTWYGDLEAEEIKERIRTGLFSSETVVVGYKYSLGMEMFLGVGAVDDISEIRFGTEMPAHEKLVTDDEITFAFDDLDFFGDPKQEGGVSGTVRVYRGTTTQGTNEYLEGVLGRPRSSYRGLVRAVFEHVYVGNRENMKPVVFIAHRYPNTLGVIDGKHIINEKDANPACMIYELLSNNVWGANINSAKIDVDNFRIVAERLHADGYGMSMLINNAQSAKGVVSEILRHIDGVLYTDNETGLLTLALARDDYDIETLPVFDENSIEEFKWSRQSWSETKNHIIINYIDREADFKERPIPFRDTANIQSRAGVVDSENIAFLGFSNATTALARGAVAAKTLGYPLLNAGLVVDGRGWNLRPGGLIVVNWPSDGIAGAVLRIVRISYQGARRNRIELDCVEDVFAVGEIGYIVPPPSNWQNPIALPAPLAAQHIFEAPYHALGDDGLYVMAVGSRNDSVTMGYQTWHDPTGGVAYSQTGSTSNFTPYGTLTATYPASTPADDPIGFTYAPGAYGSAFAPTTGGRERGESLALITSEAGAEIVAWGSIGGGIVRDVLRGVLDTVQITHPVGATVWFLSEGAALLLDNPYPDSVTDVGGKLVPYGRRGALPVGDAVALEVTLDDRAKKPYPPAKLRVNGALGGAIVGDAEITWSIRHRVLQHEDGVVVSQDAENYTDTPEGGFEVRLYIGEVLIRTETVDSAPFDTYTYDAATRTADNADLTLFTRAEVRAVNGAYASAWRSTGRFVFDDSALLPLEIASDSPMPRAAPGEAYTYTFSATGGIDPYTWSLTGGTEVEVTAGALDAASGEFSITPTTEHTYSLTVRCTDSIGDFVEEVFEFAVVDECAEYVVPQPTGSEFYFPFEAQTTLPVGNELHICADTIMPEELSVTPSAFDALAGAYYRHDYVVAGGEPPYSPTVVELPTNILAVNTWPFSSGTFAIKGTKAPTAGDYTIDFSITDSDISSAAVNETLTVLTPTAEEAALLSIYNEVGGYHAVYDFTRPNFLRQDVARLVGVEDGDPVSRVCNIAPDGGNAELFDLVPHPINASAVLTFVDAANNYCEGGYEKFWSPHRGILAVPYHSKQVLGVAIENTGETFELSFRGVLFCVSQSKTLSFSVQVAGGAASALTAYNYGGVGTPWATASVPVAAGPLVLIVVFDFNSTSDSISLFEVNGVVEAGRIGAGPPPGWLTNNGASSTIYHELDSRRIHAACRLSASLYGAEADIDALRAYLNSKAGL